MPGFGRALTDRQIADATENIEQIRGVEQALDAAVEAVQAAGLPTESVNARGQLTVWQRLEYLVDEGTWCPLHNLFNPYDDAEGSTSVVAGLGKISGKWGVIIGFDNKVLAGAWVAGQAENNHGAWGTLVI